MTFSLVGRCERNGMFGAVVTSSSPSVAARCAWARAEVGAVCTQNVTDPSLGPALLDRLAEGADAEGAIASVVESVPNIEFRQLSAVDARGRSATFSGEETLGTYAAAAAPGCAAAGNLLAGEAVPQAMVDAFLARSEEDLGDRLMAALRAGEDAGGEAGPVHSAGLVIVDRVPWAVTDLRVDWHDDPLGELERLWELWAPQAESYVTRALDPASAPGYGVPGDE
jgi:uncharacterized Ntn-hydrolase superfamily protein